MGQEVGKYVVEAMGDVVVCRRVVESPPEGVEVPEGSMMTTHTAVVVAVGPGVEKVREGDLLVIIPHVAQDLGLPDGQLLTFLREKQVVARLEKRLVEVVQ